jgi:phosphoglycerate dehydrogenase-like enzyme
MASADPQKVERLAGGREVLIDPDTAVLQARIAEIEVGFGGPPHDLVPGATGLRWMQLGGAGADRVFDNPAADRDFVVTNASGVHPIQIGEHLLAMMLAFARDIPRAVRDQLDRRWRRQDEWTVFELAGKRVVLVGLGAIGNRFAELAAAFGMQVVALRARPELGKGAAQRVAPIERLRDELPAADFVVITAPLTQETRHLVGAAELAAMKPGAYIFNIGRGPIIDEAALVDALQKGRIGGAGLDVFETEPLPADSPLWSMPNVLITPHYAGVTPHYGERLWEIFLDNLGRYARGEPLRNVVTRERGY